MKRLDWENLEFTLIIAWASLAPITTELTGEGRVWLLGGVPVVVWWWERYSEEKIKIEQNIIHNLESGLNNPQWICCEWIDKREKNSDAQSFFLFGFSQFQKRMN